VIAQKPAARTKVNEKTQVRINVSSGPKPIGVPDVRGSSFESAASQLQALGFAVARRDAESEQAAEGIVIDQEPAASSLAAKGSTITLTVSKGPTTKGVPNVENTDEQTARSQLESSGFKVRVERAETTDPSLDGIVISQDPPAGTEAKPKSKVTIVVGHFTATSTGETTTEATTTVPTP
jgi:beta-lactam-binding protein with PASTA domain